MNIHWPEDLESYIHAKVQSGQLATEDAAVAEAVRRLLQGVALVTTEEILTEVT